LVPSPIGAPLIGAFYGSNMALIIKDIANTQPS